MDLEKLSGYPSAIAGLEKNGLALKNKAQSIKTRLENIKAQFQADIALAKTEDGKKAFSNAEARDIELSKRLSGSEEFQNLSGQLDAVEKERAENEINIEQLKGEFSVERYKLRLQTADKMEQASLHFTEGLQILSGLGNLFKLLTQNPPQTTSEDEYDF
ncbi:hypothetical protein [Syntrophomonas palmitatica]|uniref:hypothetical protein n=1 Tax=Syntrophomonas palmitatica TaxID=402877 RepID=UPI0006CF2D0A|nr:hypothetical protein [Syntrophomonas palmitatica]